MKKYLITVGKEKFDVLVEGNGSVRVNGKAYKASLSRLNEETYSLLVENDTHVASVTRHGENNGEAGTVSYTITKDGKVHLVDVDDDRSILLKTIAKSSAGKHVSTLVRAPMPGLVVKLEVSAGESVKPGQGLIVLEAMKMENEIRSTLAGVVTTIHVQPGKPVEKDEPLISIEA